MPSLRHRRLKRETWLPALLLAALFLSFGLDALRAPQNQWSVRMVAASVDGYHHYIHPFTGRYIRCRYTPTCSHYAVEATRRYGIVKGSWMALRRIASCRPGVPMGTVDPVP